MQSLNDYGLHIVDAADIAHHLKFENFNEPIPLSISNLFSNPMHIIILVVSSIMLIYFVYRLYLLYRKRIHMALKATLPETLTQHMPLAPPAYEHNQNQGIPMINLNLNHK
jgi:hypothetical protein